MELTRLEIMRLIVLATGNRNYLVIQDSSSLSNSVHFATNHLYAVQRKDTEPHSSSPYNGYDPSVPMVDFDKFFDGESLDQEDIVMSVAFHPPHRSWKLTLF